MEAEPILLGELCDRFEDTPVAFGLQAPLLGCWPGIGMPIEQPFVDAGHETPHPIPPVALQSEVMRYSKQPAAQIAPIPAATQVQAQMDEGFLHDLLAIVRRKPHRSQVAVQTRSSLFE